MFCSAIAVLVAPGLQDSGAAERPALQEEWSWEAERVSSAYLSLIGSFQPEWDAARASDDDGQAVVERYVPRFLPLVERGDPDAKRWMLDFADWERAATDAKLAQTLLGYLDDLLRDHGEERRAGLLGVPMAEIWWYLPEHRDRLLARVDAYFEKTANTKGRAAIGREVADALFVRPRGAEDQERARRFCGVVLADAAETADREWARHRLDVLAWQRIGNPAPDIVGKDVDGNEVALRGARGKITVLEFWGFW